MNGDADGSAITLIPLNPHDDPQNLGTQDIDAHTRLVVCLSASCTSDTLPQSQAMPTRYGYTFRPQQVVSPPENGDAMTVAEQVINLPVQPQITNPWFPNR